MGDGMSDAAREGERFVEDRRIITAEAVFLVTPTLEHFSALQELLQGRNFSLFNNYRSQSQEYYEQAFPEPPYSVNEEHVLTFLNRSKGALRERAVLALDKAVRNENIIPTPTRFPSTIVEGHEVPLHEPINIHTIIHYCNYLGLTFPRTA